jgi:hypothetical protein
MAEAGSVVADGKRVTIHYQTGVVTAQRKQKETQIHSNVQYHGNQAVTSTSSSTVDHLELFLVDSTGKESAFNLVDLDIPVRDGNTVSVIWILPEGSKSGPYVQILNHNTGDNTVIEPKRLLPWFFKKGLMWGATIGGTIVGFIIFWPLGFAGMIGPYLYFKSRALKAIKGIFDSREYQQLSTQLSQIKPAAAVAA